MSFNMSNNSLPKSTNSLGPLNGPRMEAPKGVVRKELQPLVPGHKPQRKDMLADILSAMSSGPSALKVSSAKPERPNTSYTSTYTNTTIGPKSILELNRLGGASVLQSITPRPVVPISSTSTKANATSLPASSSSSSSTSMGATLNSINKFMDAEQREKEQRERERERERTLSQNPLLMNLDTHRFEGVLIHNQKAELSRQKVENAHKATEANKRALARQCLQQDLAQSKLDKHSSSSSSMSLVERTMLNMQVRQKETPHLSTVKQPSSSLTDSLKSAFQSFHKTNGNNTSSTTPVSDEKDVKAPTPKPFNPLDVLRSQTAKAIGEQSKTTLNADVNNFEDRFSQLTDRQREQMEADQREQRQAEKNKITTCNCNSLNCSHVLINLHNVNKPTTTQLKPKSQAVPQSNNTMIRNLFADQKGSSILSSLEKNMNCLSADLHSTDYLKSEFADVMNNNNKPQGARSAAHEKKLQVASMHSALDNLFTSSIAQAARQEAEQHSSTQLQHKLDALHVKEVRDERKTSVMKIKITCFYCESCKMYNEKLDPVCRAQNHRIVRKTDVMKEMVQCSDCKARLPVYNRQRLGKHYNCPTCSGANMVFTNLFAGVKGPSEEKMELRVGDNEAYTRGYMPSNAAADQGGFEMDG